jgi:hypothetical protein
MSVIFTGTNQGRFTSTGTPTTIQIRSDLDWMWVYNQTVQYAAGGSTGAEFYWQRGMTQGRGTVYTKTTATNALAVAQIAANAGFFLVDSSVNIPGASTAISGITGNGGAHSTPLVATANTNNLPVTAVVGADKQAGVVRIFNVAGNLQLSGLDFSVANVVSNTSFDLINMATVTTNAGTGTYRVIPFDPSYYPARRIITGISQATQAVVTLSVTHGYTVGQKVRLIVPTVTATAYGMTDLNGVQATIVAVGAAGVNSSTNTITIDVDTTGFTAFAFPLTTAPGFTPAQVVPIGENTAEALSANVNILGDATNNTGYIGILLQPGTSSPAGVLNDVIYWVAGKSFSVNNN